MVHSSLLALLLAGCPTPRTVDSADSEAPLSPYEGLRTVLVVIDGVRYTEGLGDPKAGWVPEQAALAEQGCAPGPMWNNGGTVTKFGTASIHTSIWNAWSEGGVGEDDHYHYPTHWEYLRKQRGVEQDRALYVLPGYNEASVWKPSYREGYGPEYWPLIVNEGVRDADTTQALVDRLDSHDPVFSMLYLPDVDSAGHYEGWDAYVATIAEADRLVGLLWEELQARPAFADNTVMMVTSDHGRHDDENGGFVDHGCGCDGCRQVGFLAVGPGIDPACEAGREWELVDIVPTLGAIQGYVPDDTQGSVMEGMFL